jgi:hypothetical protein
MLGKKNQETGFSCCYKKNFSSGLNMVVNDIKEVETVSQCGI